MTFPVEEFIDWLYREKGKSFKDIKEVMKHCKKEARGSNINHLDAFEEMRMEYFNYYEGKLQEERSCFVKIGLDLEEETDHILGILNTKEKLEDEAFEALIREFRSGSYVGEFYHEYHREPVGVFGEYEISGGWDHDAIIAWLLERVESLIEDSLEGTYSEEEERMIIDSEYFQRKMSQFVGRINFWMLALEAIWEIEESH